MESLTFPATTAGTERQTSAAAWRRWTGHSPLPLAAITLAAAIIRLHALAGRGLWLDEAISVSISKNSIAALFQVIRDREIYMALYYGVLHYWLLLGDSEFAIRLLSVIFSVATLPVVCALGRRLFGRYPALLAAGLLAVNSFHVRFAQEARSYSLAIFLAAVATWLLVRNLQEPQRASWAAYGVCLSLMVYSHLYTVLIVAAHAVAILCLPRDGIPWKGALKSAGWFACLTTPMLLAALRIMTKSYVLDWNSSVGFSNLPDFLVVAAGNRGFLLVALDAIAVAALALHAARARLRTGNSRESWPAVLVLLWFFLPLALSLAIAEHWPPFVPRYLLPCLPALLVAVGAGLTFIRPRSVAWTLGCAIFLFNIEGFQSCYHLSGVLDDWRGITSSIFTQARPGDAVFIYPEYARIPYDYYRDRAKPQPAWPRDVAVGDATRGNAGQGSAAAPVKRVWLILHHPSPLTLEDRRNFRAGFDAWRSRGWTLVQPQELPMVLVLLFEAASPDAAPPQQLPNPFLPAPPHEKGVSFGDASGTH